MWRTHDGWGWLMLVSGLLWTALVVVVGYLVGWLANGRRSAPGEPRESRESREPREIARRRYAAGEITRQEFLALCADLTSPPDDERAGAMSGDRGNR